MGVKYKTKVNKIPEIEKSLKGMNGKSVSIGVLKGESQWLAGIHEFGLDIEVTPKMRAFLHREGLHLKDSTTHIHIPERAFLRNGHDKNADRIIKQTERCVSLVAQGKLTVDELLDECGKQFATAIKAYTSETEPNHPFTIEKKGSSTPLTGSTGALVDGITWIKE